MPAVLPASSVEYVRVPVTASVTLDLQTVEMALTPRTATGLPPETPVSWLAAQWVGDAGLTRSCRTLIGPLTPGAYDCWVRVTDTPEIPVRVAGTVTAT